MAYERDRSGYWLYVGLNEPDADDDGYVWIPSIEDLEGR